MKSVKKYREEIAKKICCLYPQECTTCKKGRGCPDEWADVAEQVDQFLSIFLDQTKDEEGAWHPERLVVSTPSEICPYCGKNADAAMLVMGNSMAHADCVILKLNELLDPEYDGTGKPRKILVVLDGDQSLPENIRVVADDGALCNAEMASNFLKDKGFRRVRKCWASLKHFDTDSQGGRLYCCENGDYFTLVSFPFIERR